MSNFRGDRWAIGDTLYFEAQTAGSSGPVDADSAPTYRVYEQGVTAPLLTGSFTLKDATNTDGFYEASIALTAANGFENGKAYWIRKQAAVAALVGAKVDSFRITNAGAGVFNALSGWFTVTDVEGVIAAAGLTLRDSVTEDYIQGKINAVVTEITRRTRRQFVADTVDTIHYFDGSGTGLLEIDDMVSLTSVEVIGYVPSSVLWEVENVYLANDIGFPRNRLLIRQGGAAGWGGYCLNAFPEGRRNIKVTGIFGFSSSIPTDLWVAGAEEVAHRLGSEGLFNPDGRVVSWSEADVNEKYALADPATVLHWHKNFERLMGMDGYARPASRVFRAMRRTMV